MYNINIENDKGFCTMWVDAKDVKIIRSCSVVADGMLIEFDRPVISISYNSELAEIIDTGDN